MMFALPGRASDSGPQVATECGNCHTPAFGRGSADTITSCVACEGPCCSKCAEHSDDGWWCRSCLERLMDAAVEEFSPEAA